MVGAVISGVLFSVALLGGPSLDDLPFGNLLSARGRRLEGELDLGADHGLAGRGAGQRLRLGAAQQQRGFERLGIRVVRCSGGGRPYLGVSCAGRHRHRRAGHDDDLGGQDARAQLLPPALSCSARSGLLPSMN